MTMGIGDISLVCAMSLVDELAVHGMRHACVSPGSRSTPLALALARHPDIEVHVHLDERASAFFALGIAKATRTPVAVACTSGTAAAELFPAVVEASQARVPLYLLTADRPPRLRGTGANQTIDQTGLFGGYPRAFIEPPVPSDVVDAAAWRRAGREAVAACEGPQPGPVHVNCPFEEPLVPSGEPVAVTVREPGRVERPDSDPEPLAGDVDRFAEELSDARGVVVAGSSWWRAPDLVTQLAGQFGWPVIAEPTSGVRRPGTALSAGQALIASSGFLERHRPEVVLQVGATPTTRASQVAVAAAERLIVVDAFHRDPDPERRATLRLHADPDRLAAAVLRQDLTTQRPEPTSDDWHATWSDLDERARRAMDDVLDSADELTELRVARDLAATITDVATLVVGSSMPIRDLDYSMAPRDGLRVLANRGASGIDGFVSTVLGVAASGTPTYALCGDLTLLHDAGSLLWSARQGLNAVFVVPNNDGGAVFSFLPQASLPELERLFTTPHGLDLGALCTTAGAGHTRISRADELSPAVADATSAGGVHIIEVPSDRERNVEHHAEIQAAVDAALA
jgi:2-succinyl-5-enolpyruvyl-6-hydroxy-3-cyclohexene-1-carboxylate synthase